MKIISAPTSENPFLIISKEAGLPSAPLFEGDNSALGNALAAFPELRNVTGKKQVEYGLIHRIDTQTRGLILIASTQQSYDALIESQKNGLFEKWYRAKTDRIEKQLLPGFPEFEAEKKGGKLIVRSFFRKFGPKGREVRPVTENSASAALKKGGSKIYTTEIDFSSNDGMPICRITEGFRHQVRCHLAWSGNPVKGDEIYNPASSGQLEFEAFRIKFPHPLTGEMLCFENM